MAEMKPDNRVDGRIHRREVQGQKEAEFWCHHCLMWRIFREVLYRQETRLGRTSLTECTVCYAEEWEIDVAKAQSIFRSRRGANNVSRKHQHGRPVAEQTRRRRAQQTTIRPLAQRGVSDVRTARWRSVA
jgi:hypothetical protein